MTFPMFMYVRALRCSDAVTAMKSREWSGRSCDIVTSCVIFIDRIVVCCSRCQFTQVFQHFSVPANSSYKETAGVQKSSLENVVV